MKTKSLFIFVISAVLIVTATITFNLKPERNYQPRESNFSNKNKDANGAIEWLNQRRINLATGKLDINDVINVQKQLATLRQQKSNKSLDLVWKEMGPNNVGGRTRALLVDNQNDNLIFAGGVGGGLWKTTTDGTSWTKTSMSDEWANIAIASICQTKNGDIYVGTGEGLYGGNGTGTGGLAGEGIWKSTDRGNTFTRLENTWPDFSSQVTSLANLDTAYTIEIDSLTALQDTLLNAQIDSLTNIRDSLVNIKDSLVTFENDAKLAFVFVNKLATDPDDNNTVYAATNNGLLVTYDGGTTWKNPVISQIINGKIKYVNGFSSDVKVATDGSIIASIENTPYMADGKLYTKNISTITKSTQDLMLTFGEKGTVVTSSNSGNSWNNITTGLTTDLLSYSNYTNSSGMAVGALGKIFKTTDNGGHWSVIKSNTYTNFKFIKFVSNVTGFIVGENGTILKTSNGGNTWTALNPGTTKNLHSISLWSVSKGFVVGDAGFIKRTLDAGSNWAVINSGTSQNLNSIFCISPTKAFAAGDSGKIIFLKTTTATNPVTTCTTKTTNISTNLKSIYFINDSTGIAIGESGKIIKTINSGDNWSTINSGTLNSLNYIYFENDTIGFIVGDKGTLLKSIDGGNSWSTVNTGTTNNLYSFYTDDFIKITTNGAHSLAIGDIVSIKTDTTLYNTVGLVYNILSSNEILVDVPYKDTVENQLGIITNLLNLDDRSSLVTTSGRLEFAFAPSDPNYIYCSSAKSNGELDNIYQSKNKGLTWEIIGAGGNPLFEPFRNQGTYDNAIAVYPDNKDNALLGGIDVWKKLGAKFFEQTTLWNADGQSYYVHADIHAIVFHPKYLTNNTLYIGCDGGVFKSTDGGETFAAINKNYNVTQFYSVAASSTGSVIGGCQDNGTNMINFSGNTYQSSYEVDGGDGGYAHFSVIDPNIVFSSVYWGGVSRSQNGGFGMSGYTESDEQNGNFVTPFRIWESFKDTLSIDSVMVDYKNTTNRTFPTDTIIDVIGESVISAKPLYSKYKLKSPLLANQTISFKVQDYYQAMFVLGRYNSIEVSRSPLNFAASMGPFSVSANISGLVETLEFSEDGNVLYIATPNRVYRINNLSQYRTRAQLESMTAEMIGIFGTQTITSLAVDPNNSENLVVTLGNYGEKNHIYYSKNAATCTPSNTTSNFTLVQGNLPAMPVYSSLILWNDSNKVVVGTEYGTFSTSNINANPVVWDAETTFPNVATFMLRQQTFENNWERGIYNHGFIYAGTHGRGIWRTETNKGPVAVPTISKNDENAKIQVFPNPVSENANISLTLTNSTSGVLNVYDINGRLVKKLDLELYSGSNKISINVADLQKGTYFISLKTEIKQYSTKMIVL